MSDVSQGPGWWIASDGKWYPPHLHPSAAQLPPPPQSYAAPVQPAWGQQHCRCAWPSQPVAATYPPGLRTAARLWAAAGLRTTPGHRRRREGVAGRGPTGPDSIAVLHLALAPWWKRFLAILIDGMVLGRRLLRRVRHHRRRDQQPELVDHQHATAHGGTGHRRRSWASSSSSSSRTSSTTAS